MILLRTTRRARSRLSNNLKCSDISKCKKTKFWPKLLCARPPVAAPRMWPDALRPLRTVSLWWLDGERRAFAPFVRVQFRATWMCLVWCLSDWRPNCSDEDIWRKPTSTLRDPPWFFRILNTRSERLVLIEIIRLLDCAACSSALAVFKSKCDLIYLRSAFEQSASSLAKSLAD
jgi:hypothetical protein